MQQLISWLLGPAKFVLDEWLTGGTVIQPQQDSLDVLLTLITLEMLSGREVPPESGSTGG